MADIDDEHRTERGPIEELCVDAGVVEADHWTGGQSSGPYGQDEVAGLEDRVEAGGRVTDACFGERIFHPRPKWDQPWEVFMEVEIHSQDRHRRRSGRLSAV